MQSAKHENNFDLIRLLAALQTLFVHAVEWLKLPHVEGWGLWAIMSFPGVPVFFLISGFLVSKSFLDCNGRVLDFGSRRALRIFPGLWVQYLVILLLLILGGNFFLSSALSFTFLKWCFGAFFLGSEYYGYVIGGSPFSFQEGFYKYFPSGVLWSISVELGFYVLVPIVFANELRARGWTWASLAFWYLVSLSVCLTFADIRTDLPSSIVGAISLMPLTYFWVFLTGAALQLAWPKIRPFVEGKVLVWMPIYFGVSYLHSVYGGRHVLDFQNPDAVILLRTLLLGLGLLSFAYSFRRLNRTLFGVDMSYAIYLYHMPVAFTLIGFGVTGHGWIWPLIIGVTCGIAIASWFLVEKPMLNRKRQVAALVDSFADRIERAREGLTDASGSWHLARRAALMAVLLAAVSFAGGFWYVTKSYSKADMPPEAIAVDASSKNWDVTGEARASIEAGSIVLTSDLTRFGNQFQSAIVPGRKPSDYVVEYDIDVAGGQIGVGVLDAKSGRWIETLSPIDRPSGSLRFSSGGSPFRIYLFNANAEPKQTTARIKRLAARPVEDR